MVELSGKIDELEREIARLNYVLQGHQKEKQVLEGMARELDQREKQYSQDYSHYETVLKDRNEKIRLLQQDYQNVRE